VVGFLSEAGKGCVGLNQVDRAAIIQSLRHTSLFIQEDQHTRSCRLPLRHLDPNERKYLADSPSAASLRNGFDTGCLAMSCLGLERNW